MKERVFYFDFLRGVAIILVIGIHTFTLKETGVFADIEILLRQLLNCAVPLFLAISGFFLSNKICTHTNYWFFLKHQIPKIYIPCLVWSLPLFILDIIHGANWGKSFILMLVCGFSIYYFIALIIQCYILLPILVKYKKKGLILSCVLTIIAISVVTYLNQIKGLSIPLLLYAGPFPIWLAFFALGVYLGGMRQRNYRLWPFFLMFFLGIVLSFFESKYLYSFHQGGLGIKLSAHFYSFSVIMLLFSVKMEKLYSRENLFCRFITKIGIYSFGIYLIHCYFITFLHTIHVEFYWPILILVVLVLSVSFIFVIQKLFPRLVIYLGFK